MFIRLTRPLIVAVATLTLGGCKDVFQGDSTPDWALINTSKIQAAVREVVKEQNPYPADIDDKYQAKQQEYSRINEQISELKRSSMQRCMGQQNGAGARRFEGSVPQAITSVASPELHACIKSIETDQLILDLKAKAKTFTELEQRRREHDIKVQKIMDETIRQAVATYAVKNDLALIITNEPSIAYNKANQVLDVTGGVITQALSQQEASQ
ncbi:hypothetical protein D9M71_101790 [compost metagenome]